MDYYAEANEKTNIKEACLALILPLIQILIWTKLKKLFLIFQDYVVNLILNFEGLMIIRPNNFI
jgi:hypothetical protein